MAKREAPGLPFQSVDLSFSNGDAWTGLGHELHAALMSYHVLGPPRRSRKRPVQKHARTKKKPVVKAKRAKSRL